MPQTGEVLMGNLFFKVSSDGGTTHDITALVTGVQANFSFPTIDVSSQGSGGAVKRKPGKRKSVSFTVSTNVQFLDIAGQALSDDIFTLADNGTEVPWKFEPETPGSGDVSYAGNGLIEGLDFSGSDDGALTSSFNIVSTGAFSKTVTA